MKSLLFGLAFVIIAAAAAAAQSVETPQLDKPDVTFSSNGCSGFREARFFTCCFVHDFAFWGGGTWTDRRSADKALRRCIKDIAGADEFLTADIAYLLTRLGVVPGYVGVNDGWARAWKSTGRDRFDALTPGQRRVVEDEKKRVCQGLTLNPDTGNYAIAPRYLRSEQRELRARQVREFCALDR